ncbi:MAG TPA: 2,3-bisphosphoglycerate-independent phosphoglycerate mutase [Acidobacteriota bacterium]|nr:2,3-bisphosphoglycerate-independent phosphoglycerate mutase [Acidobacteriota bacterium]
MVELRKRPVVLIVRDGWGHNPYPEWNEANAVYLADTPVNDRLVKDYPTVQIHTSGEDAGLPQGVMGNSEVGHQNIGAGRIVDQEIMRITRSIRDGSFFANEKLLGAFRHARENGGCVHLLGLFSDGRVHSDMQHAFAVIDLCARLDFPSERFFVHVITDGRDTPPQSGIEFIGQLQEHLGKAGVGRVASVIGRYYAMDRDHRWDRVEEAYRMLTQGADKVFSSARAAVQHYYDHPSEPSRRGDEFITASSIAPQGQVDSKQTVKAGDSLIFFNFRGDRPRELTKAFTFSDRDWAEVKGGGFDRGEKIDDLYFATMSAYEQGLPVEVIFQKPPKMKNILGQYLSELELRQFRCAETEKFPHVTFFFNDYRDDPFPGEDRQILPSPRDVSTYDQKPEMSAPQVTEEMLRRIASGRYHLFVLNYANGDMVGHTGSLPAAVKAVEAVDRCVGRVVEAVLAKGGALLVTADHGNCEQMVDPRSGGPHTAHTTYDVDLILVDDELKGATLRQGGRLADIAPTLLALMGLPRPQEMTGRSLLD